MVGLPVGAGCQRGQSTFGLTGVLQEGVTGVPYVKKIRVPILGIHLYKDPGEGFMYLKIRGKLCRLQFGQILKVILHRE